ncbi:MAG: branched-chain amino acid ABC transporter substrate-binding protein [Defluviitaleaceae bacterium]|nr:branched-chain amino acid ABC transporter substrate-binding protein [Defluviitaleaceae bacterium]
MRKFLVVLALFSIVLPGCASIGKKSGDIVIGVLVPTSGSEAYYGKDMYQSYQLAVSEINAAGGILGRQISLYQADDGCDANMSSQAASKIITHGVDFVVGGYCSGATIPALQQFYDENLIMLISAANSTDITKLGLNQSFMINSPGTHAAVTLAALCKHVGAKNVALVHQGDAYTMNLSDICEEALPKYGINIATVQVMEKGAADVSAIVTAIRNAGADFVYWCGYHADGSNVIKQLRQGGYEGDIAVGDGSASVELIEACGSAGEGVYVTSPPFVEFAEGGEQFIADYKAMHEIEPGTYATLCYDTIYLLKKAIEQSNSFDFAKVRDAIQGIEYKGLSGLLKFTDERELAVSNFIILQISGGSFRLIQL